MVDLATVQSALNQLTTATIGQLRALVQSAVDAENIAVNLAYTYNLPGGDGRYNTLSRLQAHLDDLNAISDDSRTVVGAALDTVKADVIAACVDLNAAVEGSNYQQAARERIYSDIVDNARGLANAVVDGVNSIVDGVKGLASGTVSALEAIAIIAAAALLGTGIYLLTKKG